MFRPCDKVRLQGAIKKGFAQNPAVPPVRHESLHCFHSSSRVLNGKYYTSSQKALSPALRLLTLCISLRSLARHFRPIYRAHVWYFGPRRWVLHFRLCCTFSDNFGIISTWFWVECNTWLDCTHTNSSACQSLRHSTSHSAHSSPSSTPCTSGTFFVTLIILIV